MRKTQSSVSLIAGALALAAVVALPVSTRAETLSFNVVSGSSSLTLSGQAFGLGFTGQGGNPSALVDSWGGTIAADLTAGVITFTGGGGITALLNPLTPFSTDPFPPAGGVDNYGPFAQGLVTGFGFVVVNGAYRDLTLDITAGTATDGAVPAGMTLAFIGASKLDYGATAGGNPAAGGTSLLDGVGGANTSASLVSFDGTTLTLPVTFATTGSNRSETWTGTIVAVVPEPSSLVLLGVGLMGLVGSRLHRSRRSL